MLIIKAQRDSVLKPLQTVAGIVEKRTTLPILSNVLIRQDGETVSFTGTDIEMQIRTSAGIGASEQAHATTVSARKLIDILRSLGDGEVGIDLDNNRLRIKSGKSRFALQTLGANDFPTVNVSADAACEAIVSRGELRHLLQLVHFAMAQQDIRFYLNGLLLVFSPDGLRAVATDGHRLAFAELKDVKATAEAEVIVPRKTVLELLRLLDDGDAEARLQVLGHQLRVSFGDIEILTKLVEGKFPDYQRVIPSGYTKHVEIERELFAQALGRASILTNEKFKGVRLTLTPSLLKIQSNNAEQEEASEDVDIDYDGAGLEIGFNVSYLLDVLGNLKTEKVCIEFGDANSSALVSLPGDEGFKYVIMPMRI